MGTDVQTTINLNQINFNITLFSGFWRLVTGTRSGLISILTLGTDAVFVLYVFEIIAYFLGGMTLGLQ